jgi:hypothetical protein
MNTVVRVGTWATAILIGIALVAYGSGYYVCIHRNYRSIAAGTDCLYVDEATHTFFWPAIWIYEQTSGREVAINPMVHPRDPG